MWKGKIEKSVSELCSVRNTAIAGSEDGRRPQARECVPSRN